jgi:hypothetical protein
MGHDAKVSRELCARRTEDHFEWAAGQKAAHEGRENERNVV